MTTFAQKTLVHLRKISSAWTAARAGTFGASVAYYTVFSLAPLLVVTIAVMSFFIEKSDATASILAEFSNVFGSSGSDFVSSLIQSNATEGATLLATVVGIAVLLIGAIGIFSELQTALDVIFERLPEKKGTGFWEVVRDKALALGLVLSLGFVLLTSLLVSTAISYFTANLAPGADMSFAVRFIELAASLVVVWLFLSITYKFLPSHRLQWKSALSGGFVAAVLFTVSKLFLGYYFGSIASFSGYGAASALVVIILWVYYMAQVFFLSAILTKLYVVPKSELVQ